MSSDEDQPVVESLYVGFDADMRLVITIEHVDYDEPEDSCSVSAVIDKEGTFELSKKLQVYPEHRGLGIFKCKPCVFEERKGCDDRDSKCCLSPLLFAAS